jgi:hypothetical protein
MFADRPQTLASPSIREERRAMLETADHIQSLEQWRAEYIATRSVPVPHFDPADAGDQARVLFVLDKPPAIVVSPEGSGFVSVDNPDPAAERCWTERNAAGLHDGVLMWNMVPFYTETEGANEKVAGAKALGSVLRLLPRLRVVILCSLTVQQTWAKHLADRAPRAITIKAPGVGMQAMARQAKQEEFRQAIQRAKGLVG